MKSKLFLKGKRSPSKGPPYKILGGQMAHWQSHSPWKTCPFFPNGKPTSLKRYPKCKLFSHKHHQRFHSQKNPDFFTGKKIFVRCQNMFIFSNPICRGGGCSKPVWFEQSRTLPSSSQECDPFIILPPPRWPFRVRRLNAILSILPPKWHIIGRWFSEPLGADVPGGGVLRYLPYYSTFFCITSALSIPFSTPEVRGFGSFGFPPFCLILNPSVIADVKRKHLKMFFLFGIFKKTSFRQHRGFVTGGNPKFLFLNKNQCKIWVNVFFLTAQMCSRFEFFSFSCEKYHDPPSSTCVWPCNFRTTKRSN